MSNVIEDVVQFLSEHDGSRDKDALATRVATEFKLVRDRSVFYGPDFAIRFSSSGSRNFSNTVLSLSNLRKYDEKPFIVCLVTPFKNYLLLANSTFLKKISHSSQDLREDNIRGSFNGSDIVREFEGIPNDSANIERLFAIHSSIGFDGNLPRLVEATTNISPSGKKFAINDQVRIWILDAPIRAEGFSNSSDARALKSELDATVVRFSSEILLASLIENVNVRGRVIEYLIAGQSEQIRAALVSALHHRAGGLPAIRTGNGLGDYERAFDSYDTTTDVKTKVMFLNSNPKAYNIDKALEFLARPRSVFMIYFVGVDASKIFNTALVSMFEPRLLRGTIVLRHWAGRNSRGVTQFEGRTVNRLISSPAVAIEQDSSIAFLERLMSL